MCKCIYYVCLHRCMWLCTHISLFWEGHLFLDVFFPENKHFQREVQSKILRHSAEGKILIYDNIILFLSWYHTLDFCKAASLTDIPVHETQSHPTSSSGLHSPLIPTKT